MDTNKLKVLRDAKYTIRKVCGNCSSGRFKKGNPFGECLSRTYTHEKHTGEKRQLSVHQTGYCDYHVFAEEETDKLHGFYIFLEK